MVRGSARCSPRTNAVTNLPHPCRAAFVSASSYNEPSDVYKGPDGTVWYGHADPPADKVEAWWASQQNAASSSSQPGPTAPMFLEVSRLEPTAQQRRRALTVPGAKMNVKAAQPLPPSFLQLVCRESPAEVLEDMKRSPFDGWEDAAAPDIPYGGGAGGRGGLDHDQHHEARRDHHSHRRRH